MYMSCSYFRTDANFVCGETVTLKWGGGCNSAGNRFPLYLCRIMPFYLIVFSMFWKSELPPCIYTFILL